MQNFEYSVASLVRVSGEDALPYLQSQLSIDLYKLAIGSTRLGLRLSLKGKILLSAQIIRSGEEEFILVCQDSSAEHVIGLLEENVVADEVEFEIVAGSWMASHLHHPGSYDQALEKIGLEKIQAGNAYAHQAGWVYIDPLFPQCCLTVLYTLEKLPSWRENMVPSDSSMLEHMRLRAGLYRPGLELGEEEFPQEGGLEKIAVDFDKGCYLGQEVMARIHAMGNVRKQAVTVEGREVHQGLLPLTLLNQQKKVGSLKSQFSLPGKKEWIGAAVIHENSISILKNEGLQIEGSEETIYPLK